MHLVIVESPYAGNVERNALYLKLAMHGCLQRGEAPFASHMLYTQILDDTVHVQRELGIAAGLAWGRAAVLTVVYEDFGISGVMQRGIDRAVAEGRAVEHRKLGDEIKSAIENALLGCEGGECLAWATFQIDCKSCRSRKRAWHRIGLPYIRRLTFGGR
jgi:hypothetical protein